MEHPHWARRQSARGLPGKAVSMGQLKGWQRVCPSGIEGQWHKGFTTRLETQQAWRPWGKAPPVAPRHKQLGASCGDGAGGEARLQGKQRPVASFRPEPGRGAAGSE